MLPTIRLRTLALFLCASLLITACSDSNDRRSGPPDIDGTGIQLVKPGQALLGPLVGASVKVYDASDFVGVGHLDLDGIDPVCDATTSSSDKLDDAGLIHLPDTCIDPTHLYLVRVIGGDDIDVDDDGVLDDSPHPHDGEIHALILGQRMMDAPWKVTRVTQTVYLMIQTLLQSGLTAEESLTQIDLIAALILDDVTGDGLVDHNDVFEWNPRYHAELFNAAKVDDIDNSVTLARELIGQEIDGAVTHVDTGFKANMVAVEDDYAYVATNNLLHVLDIKNPTETAIVASVIIEQPLEMKINGEYLYVRGQQALTVYDISDPLVPRSVSSLPWQYSKIAIAQNGYVWAAAPSLLGVRVFTLADLTTPYWEELIVEDEQELLAFASGIKKFRDEVTFEPASQSSLELFKFFGNIAVLGYTGFSEATVHVVDFSNVDNPSLLSEIVIAGSLLLPLDALLIDNQLQLSIGMGSFSTLTFTQSFHSYDISNPADPLAIEVTDAHSLRSFALAGDQLVSWNADDSISVRALLDLDNEVRQSIPSIVDSTFQTYSDYFMLLLGLEDPLAAASDPTILAAAANLMQNYNFTGRLAAQQDYQFFAAAQYGLLVYQLQIAEE